jgi:hypothetical protein
VSRGKRDPNYPAMPPIARLHRPWIFTEKLNGTNGLIVIADVEATARAGTFPPPLASLAGFGFDQDSDAPVMVGVSAGIWAGSKNQWLGPDGDNFGFGRWVRDNATALIETLGGGIHRGEWWGSGIQTGYGLPKGERRFSLFNTSKWTSPGAYVAGQTSPDAVVLDDAAIPGLGVVPVLEAYVDGHDLNATMISWLDLLQYQGSHAAPGFMDAEGVVAYQPSSGSCFKATIRNDDIPKSLAGR